MTSWLEQLYSRAVAEERTGISSLLAHLCEAGKIQSAYFPTNLEKAPIVVPHPSCRHVIIQQLDLVLTGSAGSHFYLNPLA